MTGQWRVLEEISTGTFHAVALRGREGLQPVRQAVSRTLAPAPREGARLEVSSARIRSTAERRNYRPDAARQGTRAHEPASRSCRKQAAIDDGLERLLEPQEPASSSRPSARPARRSSGGIRARATGLAIGPSLRMSARWASRGVRIRAMARVDCSPPTGRSELPRTFAPESASFRDWNVFHF